MKTPGEGLEFLKSHMVKRWKIAFLSTFFLGLMIHFPVWAMDVPNHDGLASMYFDQNMITSGRWFLTVACGISSYYTLPWLIGLLSMVWISITSVILIEILEVKKTEWVILISALLVSFPALASTYAYLYTADGYMLALLLAVLAVYLTKRFDKGFLAGGICLAFSMGTYQAYLPVCILLCIYVLLQKFLGEGTIREKTGYVLKFLGMGIIGSGLYYVLLQILLRLEGKVLDTYQGINGMTSFGGRNLLGSIKSMYQDFFTFLLKGNIIFNNGFSLAACLLLLFLAVFTLFRLARERRLYRSPWFYGILAGVFLLMPPVTNLILFISPDVGYHLLMRYQYVFLLIFGVAFVSRRLFEKQKASLMQWLLLAGGAVLCFNFAISVNIGYSNLQKRYEKTYAYCIRLADRIEQTEGYYRGMPVVIMGVVGDENFPTTDITEEVTGNMIGLCGDFLCYTGPNYKEFFKNYLGVTIEIVEQEKVGEIYETSEIYQSLNSFPDLNCSVVVDGMLYIKTENKLEEY